MSSWSMRGCFMCDERVAAMISDWLERNYPDGPTWYDRGEEYLMPAFEIRMTYAFTAVEYNISNGGWAQFLWNCFPYWRAIIADAKQGYLLIGAPQQSAALSAPGNDWEELFWDDALYEKHLAWLAANEARVRAALGLN